MASPPPFPLHTALYFLQYISPLGGPIPRHLLSDALFQRHQFLQLTPSDPRQYLCWPTEPEDDTENVVNILNKYPYRLQDDNIASSGTVRYTYDGDFIYAHVHLEFVDHDDTSVRIIFQWDNNSATNDDITGWKYHDTKLMPFPPDSCSTISDIMAYTVFSQDDTNSTGDYDALDNEGISYRSYAPQKRIVEEPVGGDSENAYWAKYASVEESVISMDGPSQFSEIQRSKDNARSSSLLSLNRSQYSDELENFTLPAESTLTVPPLVSALTKQLAQLTEAPSSSSPPSYNNHHSEDNSVVSSPFFTLEERRGVNEMIKGTFTIWSSLARYRGNLSFEERKIEFMKVVNDAIQNE